MYALDRRGAHAIDERIFPRRTNTVTIGDDAKDRTHSGPT
jgi:hypothetical protein